MILLQMLTVFVLSKDFVLLVFLVSKIPLDLPLLNQLRFLKELVLKLLCAQVIILTQLLLFPLMLVLSLKKKFKKARMVSVLIMKKRILKTMFAWLVKISEKLLVELFQKSKKTQRVKLSTKMIVLRTWRLLDKLKHNFGCLLVHLLKTNTSLLLVSKHSVKLLL